MVICFHRCRCQSSLGPLVSFLFAAQGAGGQLASCAKQENPFLADTCVSTQESVQAAVFSSPLHIPHSSFEFIFQYVATLNMRSAASEDSLDRARSPPQVSLRAIAIPQNRQSSSYSDSNSRLDLHLNPIPSHLLRTSSMFQASAHFDHLLSSSASSSFLTFLNYQSPLYS